MEHCADEFDAGRFIGILLFKLHDQAEGTVFEGSVGWTNYDSVPREVVKSGKFTILSVGSDHVMTLSAMGDAETPAGGSVCMR